MTPATRARAARNRAREARLHRTALAAFLEHQTAIAHQLARLTAHVADHLGTDPDTLHWGHVGDVAHLRAELVALCDRAFGEGEYSPERNRR